MAKFNGSLVILEETNLPALYYMRYLIRSRKSEVKAPPVQYYDEIDKKLIDEKFSKLKTSYDYFIAECIVNSLIASYTKTVYHGFKYTIINDNIRDEGLANKLKSVEAKSIKEHKTPYNHIFKRYSVNVYNG